MRRKRRPGRNHAAHGVRESATVAERHLWSRLRENQLGVRFTRQGRIGRHYATFVARSGKVAVEIDRGGTSGRYDSLQRITTAIDTDYKVLVFWEIDVLSDTDHVVDTIRSALKNPTRQRPEVTSKLERSALSKLKKWLGQ